MSILVYTYMQTYIHIYVACIYEISMSVHTYIYMHKYILIYVSHRGVFRTTKSLVHALGNGSSMTEPTINSTL